MLNKITILGSGTSFSSFYNNFDYRNPSGHLLQFEGKNILLDCGEGIRRKMEEMQFDYYDLDVICISHFHPDHFTLEPMIQALLMRAVYEKRTKDLIIYGPKHIQEIVEYIWDKKTHAGYSKTILPQHLNLQYIEFIHGQSTRLTKNIRLTPYKVSHGLMDAYALRFYLGKKIFSYSGDSGVCDGLLSVAKDADIFVCEASINTNNTEADTTEHLSSHLAGEIAKKSHTKQLILVHYSGKDSKEDMKGEVVAAGYKGIVNIASDLESFTI